MEALKILLLLTVPAAYLAAIVVYRVRSSARRDAALAAYANARRMRLREGSSSKAYLLAGEVRGLEVSLETWSRAVGDDSTEELTTARVVLPDGAASGGYREDEPRRRRDARVVAVGRVDPSQLGGLREVSIEGGLAARFRAFAADPADLRRWLTAEGAAAFSGLRHVTELRVSEGALTLTLAGVFTAPHEIDRILEAATWLAGAGPAPRDTSPLRGTGSLVVGLGALAMFLAMPCGMPLMAVEAAMPIASPFVCAHEEVLVSSGGNEPSFACVGADGHRRVVGGTLALFSYDLGLLLATVLVTVLGLSWRKLTSLARA